MRILLIAVFLASLFTGCSNMNEREKGALIGAGVGGAAGHVLTDNPIGAAAGAAAGGAAGYEIGRRREGTQ